MPRLIINLLNIKDKEKILKAVREKQYVTYKRTKMQMIGFLIRNHGDQMELV